MAVLSIDSSSKYSSVCIIDDDLRIIASSDLGPHENHSILIFKQLDEMFSKVNIPLNKLKGIAVTLGPGSFTGVRVSLSIAKTLAFCLGLNILGVGSLYACAYSFISKYRSKYIIVIKDFIKDYVYFSVFLIKNNEYTEYGRLTSATVSDLSSDLSSIIEQFEEAPVVVYSYNKDQDKNVQNLKIKVEHAVSKIRGVEFETFDSLKVSYFAGILALKSFIKNKNATDLKYIEELSPFYIYSGGAF